MYNLIGDFMYTVSNNINHEIIINKSRFITFIIKVYNEDEVKTNLDIIKNKYKDATHYCYSYIIDNVKRFNDDGEPGGTAGMPILNVLENNNLNYALCVVVRYFGGIKLGAGGLVRAYSKSASDTLKQVTLKKLSVGKEVSITFNYDKIKFFDNLLKNVDDIEKIYDEIITYNIKLTNEEYMLLENTLKDNCITINIKDNITIEKAI